MFLRPYTHGRQNAGVAYVFISVSVKHTAMFLWHNRWYLCGCETQRYVPPDTTGNISVCKTQCYVPRDTTSAITVWGMDVSFFIRRLHFGCIREILRLFLSFRWRAAISSRKGTSRMSWKTRLAWTQGRQAGREQLVFRIRRLGHCGKGKRARNGVTNWR